MPWRRLAALAAAACACLASSPAAPTAAPSGAPDGHSAPAGHGSNTSSGGSSHGDSAHRLWPGAPLDCPTAGCPDCAALGLDRPVEAADLSGSSSGSAAAAHGSLTWFEQNCRLHVSADVEWCIDLLWRSNASGEIVHEAGAHDAVHDSTPYNILVIFASFAVGAFVRFVFLDTGVPYTVVLFLLGMIYGGVATWDSAKDKLRPYVELAEINPHLIFHIFLPVLIFESAFAMHIPTFRKVIGQCLILAVPGIMVAAGLTGAMAKVLFVDYDWPWTACLLFGTILSATDPVAVVALLKELGASPVISTMIEGESLFNDGTAIVFFNVLLESVLVKSCTPTWDKCFGGEGQCLCPEFECEMPLSIGEIVLEFFKVSLGGPLIGLIVARIAVFSLNKVFNDPLIEITLTLVVAYVTFFLAEGMFHVSGVLGVVACGCYMSHFRQCISPEVEHTMHHFWEMTVYLTNTMIFLLAGIIVSLKAFSTVTLNDVLYLLYTYVAINVVRSVVLLLFMPFLRMFEYKVDLGSTCLVAWGGLRGAVGLALALIIEGDDSVAYDTVRHKVMFHVAGIVVMTLCINGTTTGKLVAYFQLDKVPDRNKRMMRDRFRALCNVQKESVRDLRAEALYYDTNWEVVDRLTELQSKLRENFEDPFNRKGTVIGAGEDPAARQRSLQEDARCVYLNAVVSSVHNQQSRGTLSRRGVRKILEWATKTKELKEGTGENPLRAMRGAAVAELFQIKDCCATPFGGGKGGDVAARVRDPSGMRKRRLQALWREAFDITLGFIACHQLAQARVVSTCTRREGAALEQHCKAAITEAKRQLLLPSLQHPEISCGIKTRQAARDVLNHMRIMLGTMAHNGRVDAQDKAALLAIIEHRMRGLRKMPGSISPPSREDILRSCPWFQKAEEQAQAELLAICQEESSLVTLEEARAVVQKRRRESVISERHQSFGALHAKSWQQGAPAAAEAAVHAYEQGSKKDLPGVYVIITGIVELRVGRSVYKLGSGYTLGLQQLLCPGAVSGRRFSDVWTETRSSFLFLSAERMLPLIEKYPALANALWRQAGENAARVLMPLEGKWKTPVWDATRVRRLALKGEVEHVLDPAEGFTPSDRRLVQLHQPCVYVLVRGRCWEYETTGEDDDEVVQINAFRFPCLLPSTFKFATFSENAVLFAMDEDMTAGDRARRLWGRLRAKIRSINLWAGLRGEQYRRCAIAIAFRRTPATKELQAFAAQEQGRAAKPLGDFSLDRGEGAGGAFAARVESSQQLAQHRRSMKGLAPVLAPGGGVVVGGAAQGTRKEQLRAQLARLEDENRALRGGSPLLGAANPLGPGRGPSAGSPPLGPARGPALLGPAADRGPSSPAWAPASPVLSPQLTASPAAQLRELASLRADGALSETEFAAAKAQILGLDSPRARRGLGPGPDV
eukprot:TRINITY_DN16917_c0_g1_i1.p1 TRINITY_DN16917_c0_g1~~TRINITY_DN16917_c0_g1_i1.p1  ORF type:complete len:1444 (+),score=522.94 TRINITY_DN16917_c0_g1_i1:84-4334(+)